MPISDLKQTHTFVTLELSPAAWLEIYTKLKSAGYDHAFLFENGEKLIDMYGIAVQPLAPDEVPT